MAAIITHVAFYAGWPKAWAVFNLAKEVYGEESEGLTENCRGSIFRTVRQKQEGWGGRS